MVEQHGQAMSGRHLLPRTAARGLAWAAAAAGLGISLSLSDPPNAGSLSAAAQPASAPAAAALRAAGPEGGGGAARGVESRAGALVLAHPSPGERAAALTLAQGEPVLLGYRVVRPDGPARDGDWVEFFTFWAGADTVWVDLRALDALAAPRLGAVYVGDSSIVAGDTLHTWPCYWSAQRISPDNPLPDAAGLPAVVSAVSAAGDTTTTDLVAFCLSNDPPRHLGTVIDAPANRLFSDGERTVLRARNGELIHVETTWHYSVPSLFVTGDFSAADDSFAAERVIYEPVAQPADSVQTHGIYYRLDDQAQGEDSLRVPVRVIGRDGGCGEGAYTFLIDLDNRGPAGRPVFDDLPATALEPTLIVTGTAPRGSEDVRIVLNQAREYLASIEIYGDTLWRFRDTLELQGGANHIVAYGRDLVGNLSEPSLAATIDLLHAPEFKTWQLLSPVVLDPDTTVSATVRDGDVVVLRSYWDSRAEYNLFADFSAIDANFAPEAVLYSRCEDREAQVGGETETWACYQIEYRISPDNPLDDAANQVVPVTAFDPSTGFSRTTTSLRLCLSNAPPVHLRTYPVDNVHYSVRDGDSLIVARNGSTIRLHTEWIVGNRRSLSADFSLLDQHTSPQRLLYGLVDSLSVDSLSTFWVRYRVHEEACCGEGQVAYPVPVTIRVFDSGCGVGAATVFFEMDNEGPAAAPWIDPPLPAAVSTPEVAVRGIAPQAADVLVRVSHVDADSLTDVVLAADSLGQFDGSAPLLPGLNRLVAYGRDVLGNLSPASAASDVRRASDRTSIEIPQVFRPGDRFVLQNPEGWTSVQVAVYNLEGDLVREWRKDGEVLFFEIPWDGRNGRDEVIHSGPYLVRVRLSGGPGSREEVKAFVFKR